MKDLRRIYVLLLRTAELLLRKHRILITDKPAPEIQVYTYLAVIFISIILPQVGLFVNSFRKNKSYLFPNEQLHNKRSSLIIYDVVAHYWAARQNSTNFTIFHLTKKDKGCIIRRHVWSGGYSSQYFCEIQKST